MESKAFSDPVTAVVMMVGTIICDMVSFNKQQALEVVILFLLIIMPPSSPTPKPVHTLIIFDNRRVPVDKWTSFDTSVPGQS